MMDEEDQPTWKTAVLLLVGISAALSIANILTDVYYE